jgi:single-strand DNA-binding protein
MPNFNKVILAGRLTRDVQLRFTKNGKPVCNGGLAVNKKWTDDAGTAFEDTLFIDFVAWNRTAETLNEHTSKGSGLLIEGALKMDSYDDAGTTRTKHLIVVETFQFLDSKGQAASASAPATAKPATKPQPARRS